jgi:hypothetical protein
MGSSPEGSEAVEDSSDWEEEREVLDFLAKREWRSRSWGASMGAVDFLAKISAVSARLRMERSTPSSGERW